MISLLVWACLATAPTECRVIQIAQGFVADKQCEAYSPLMVTGWLKLNPGLHLRDGTRPICTTQGQYLLYRFGA